MLIENIKRDQLLARKARNTIETNVLTTLLGDIAIVGKNNGNRDTTIDEAKNVITKFHKNLNETLKLQEQRGDDTSTTIAEITIVERYMPRQLTDDQLRTIIKDFITSLNISSIKEMGKLMKEINSQYKGQYNGQRCKQLIEEYFA